MSGTYGHIHTVYPPMTRSQLASEGSKAVAMVLRAVLEEHPDAETCAVKVRRTDVNGAARFEIRVRVR